MPSDMLMFEKSGVSIAMGNASPEVRKAAKHVTTTNEEEGFAIAVMQYVLHARTGGHKSVT
jgi:hydroxymethylpyrimidine pyrophosphatase-like HAD family hydrolase